MLRCTNDMMRRKNSSFASVLALFLLPAMLVAQDVSQLLTEAKKFESEFKQTEALNKYLEILKVQPAHFVALCKASELHTLLGKRQPTKEKQRNYFNTAKSYAQQALKLNAAST